MDYVSIHFERETIKYTFSCQFSDLQLEDPVVVETATGLEIGYVASKVMSEQEAKLPDNKEIKPIIRKASEYDLVMYEQNKVDAKQAFAICERCIKECELEMDLMDAQYTLDHSKVLFTYVAEKRVDFRELLKLLNSELKCRVELRQIAIRQRAKHIGGLGPCGRALCCCTFMTSFSSVSINLAKNQNISLNASKLTGSCGKLKCCLKFEDDMYTQLAHGLPKLNSWVEYEGEKFKIASLNYLSNYCRLDNPMKSKMITVDQLRTECTPTTRPQRNNEEVKTESKPVRKVVEDNRDNKKENIVKPVSQPVSSVKTNADTTTTKRVFGKNNNGENKQESNKPETTKRVFTKTNKDNNNTNNDKRVFKSNKQVNNNNTNSNKRFFSKKKDDSIRIIQEDEAE